MNYKQTETIINANKILDKVVDELDEHLELHLSQRCIVRDIIKDNFQPLVAELDKLKRITSDNSSTANKPSDVPKCHQAQSVG